MDLIICVNNCLFFITSIDKEKIYCKDKVRISNLLNSCLHKFLILEFIKILITLF